MRQGPDLPAVLDVEVTTHGQLPGSEDYARTKIGELGRLTHQPVLHAHVRLSEHGDPAVARRVIAQANLDVNGRLVREPVLSTRPRSRWSCSTTTSTCSQRRARSRTVCCIAKAPRNTASHRSIRNLQTSRRRSSCP